MELEPDRALAVASKVTAELAPYAATITLFPVESGYASRVRVSLGEVMGSNLAGVVEQLRALQALAEQEDLDVEIVQPLDVILKARGAR